MKETYFKEQTNGYDKTQVDNYIRKLQKAYQTVYAEYLELYDGYYKRTRKMNYNIQHENQTPMLKKG